MVTLSYGTTINPDGSAINDFQTFADGAVTDLNFNVTVNSGASWNETQTFLRT
jgi:hypothetical protein